MDKDSIIYYRRWARIASQMDDSLRLLLFDTLNAYILEGAMPPKDSPIYWTFLLMLEQVKADASRYEAISEKRKEAIKKRWEKEKSSDSSDANGYKCIQNIQMNTKHTDNDNDNDNVNDNDNDNGNISILSDTMDSSLSSSPIVEEELFKEANASTSSHDDAPLVLTPPEEPKGRKKDYSLNVMSFWNNSVKGANVAMPTIAKMTDRRKAVVNARVSEYGINKVYQAISKAVESTFLNGGGSRGFIADFDWVMRPNNFPKVLEGSYSNNGGSPAINMNQDGNVQQPRSREQREADLRNKERLEYLSKKYGDIG